ncbi:hypothetical protein [Lichenicoccus sp.]|uniref:hypothetical protein n=1 Tax=Lichenicoccus sp. TaxID=2781899 RepID=UPI003D125FD3
MTDPEPRSQASIAASRAALDHAAVDNQFRTVERLPFVMRHQRTLVRITMLFAAGVLALDAIIWLRANP